MMFIDKTLLILTNTPGSQDLFEQTKSRFDDQALQVRGIPKSLLPVSNRPVLSWWYDVARTAFAHTYIAANAHNYKKYEQWASDHSFPIDHIVNSGLRYNRLHHLSKGHISSTVSYFLSTSALADIACIYRVKNIGQDVVVVFSDFLYEHHPEFLSQLKEPGDCCIVSTQLEIPIAYTLSQSTLHSIEQYLEENQSSFDSPTDELTHFMTSRSGTASLVHIPHKESHEFMLPTVTLDEYLRHWSKYSPPGLERKLSSGVHFSTEPIETKAYARVGLMGNPSDGFYGKTLSLLISNFWAEVVILPNAVCDPAFSSIRIIANAASDPSHHTHLGSLSTTCLIDGYENGHRLLLACCKVFYTYCQNNKIPIDIRQGFRVLFDTNIPRQVGLAGSSAIVTAFWKGLLRFYGVTEQQISLEKQASLILSVEQDELGITAGLQDRVIQVYGGLVYMNFEKSYMDQNGYGQYEYLDMNLLPPLWLAYVAKPKDSGKVHSTIRQRFLKGDTEVIEAMNQFADFTESACQSLRNNDHHTFAQLMTANFELRRKLYGDDVVGSANLRMVEIARQNGCVAKLPGSGGAVVGMWHGQDPQSRDRDMYQLKRDLESDGFVFVNISPLAAQP
ncbi:ribosomal protein S5 domain 2-type protein [Radiomyces spectabilis]|uniref:ribosomal protein S5 domain 2-type protein n=1 Tax=Radiomyces spectabilis TaxID=64574 RepID=UPI00222065C5|nr:ribosomal protein S5 domain 2-type protein [Radiomyces spectabilis]KAI8388033.1 ribosomal protein S5 domain 2-type protein [Radiomyces spectabilis]